MRLEWAIGSLCASAVVLGLCLRTRPEPAFGGKTASQWLDAGQEDACQALHEIGPPALPFVLAKFAREDPEHGTANWYRGLWLRLPLKARGVLPQPVAGNFDESRACLALMELGPRSIPGLARALEDRNPTVRGLSARVLGRWRRLGKEIGPALPGLLRAANDPDAMVRQRAAEALKINAALAHG